MIRFNHEANSWQACYSYDPTWHNITPQEARYLFNANPSMNAPDIVVLATIFHS
jgi:hypothetical protein